MMILVIMMLIIITTIMIIITKLIKKTTKKEGGFLVAIKTIYHSLQQVKSMALKKKKKTCLGVRGVFVSSHDLLVIIDLDGEFWPI